jgi:hypothetical protein
LSVRVRAVLAALGLIVAAVGCSSDDGGEDPAEAAAPTSTSDAPDAAGPPVEVDDDEALYAEPEPVPAGEHGDLLRYQRVETDVAGTTRYRVMYLSESVEGDPIVVTGTVVVPTTPAPDGGRPVLAVAHGTTGIADSCAPSKGAGAAELALTPSATQRGWIVAVSDYEGLGTPGRHPYLVGESEGRGVIDAVLAAGQLPDAERSDTTLIAGYSQGGHGALWAGQVAEEWAPELEVVGTFAGAPATELGLILSAAGSPAASGFAFLIVAGFQAAHPEADPASFLTEKGVDLLGAVDEGCIRDVFGALAGQTDLVRPDGPASSPWPQLAAENDPGRVATDDPVLIIHSDQDEVVPAFLSGLLFDRMCGLGQHAERRVLEGGGSHRGAAVTAYAQAIGWFDRLLAGDEVPDTCP